METQEQYTANPEQPQPQPQPQKKYYKVINSDVFFNKKLIPEGTVIDTFDPSLSKFLRELTDQEISATPNFYSTVNDASAPKRGRGRPRKSI